MTLPEFITGFRYKADGRIYSWRVITDTREGDGTTGHWYDVLAELGLTQVVLEEKV